MVKTFNTPIFKKSHPHLTSAVIRKYFPTACPDCPFGNLQMRHPPVDPPIHHDPGAVFEVDVQGKWTDSDGKPVKSFGGDLYAIAAVDCASNLIFARTTQIRVSLVDHLESLRVSVASTGKLLKTMSTSLYLASGGLLHMILFFNHPFLSSITLFEKLKDRIEHYKKWL
jgi:hypothetical protein